MLTGCAGVLLPNAQRDRDAITELQKQVDDVREFEKRKDERLRAIADELKRVNELVQKEYGPLPTPTPTKPAPAPRSRGRR
jgi:uncharacterized coiled-coil protein SlyX